MNNSDMKAFAFELILKSLKNQRVVYYEEKVMESISLCVKKYLNCLTHDTVLKLIVHFFKFPSAISFLVIIDMYDDSGHWTGPVASYQLY